MATLADESAGQSKVAAVCGSLLLGTVESTKKKKQKKEAKKE